MKNILVITDNEQALLNFKELIRQKQFSKYKFHFSYSYNNKEFLKKYGDKKWIRPVNVNDLLENSGKKFDMIISLHCKQLFPKELIAKIKCINVHPGYNPFNRGWFPQVFSIINGLPCGASVCEMDEKIDHGPIIVQKEIKIESYDTSLSCYTKILEAEIALLNEHLEEIIEGHYKPYSFGEGNLNLKKDFFDLCKIDLDNKDTFLNHIDRLRALSHGPFSNAYFIDKDGKKVFVKIDLTKEKSE